MYFLTLFVIMTITNKNGLFTITAKTAIDATGDANLIQIAGYPVEKARYSNRQHYIIIFRVMNLMRI